ncbi:isoprenylcysteine carboxyl methyltransferase family protein [Rhodospirillum centenum]|uniref:Isoprenylcysteine carboxyl methyltransferase (ICMT) family n=2 Tax=Rhodospirillum centenum TaxID=34018 RepID=B6IT05_RHOCS|nr:isoprenylcysteine carboxylmethyltransferase family protein [Rhodospirillum centenum]AAD43970.1 unknown [Rhodospirillum centenum]ACI98676.1 Isoprenylcysteine carboxyl methyltransferase (ICMT) family [Rhodospirillum centenum SW]
MTVGLPHLVFLLVAVQRLAELALARRNTRRLLARGAVETGAGHYPLFVLLHGGWLAALFLTVPADAPVSWPLLALFVLLQAGRVWVVASLGPYWTTRIITLPGAPLIRRGPFRHVRHPNYLVVTGEIAVLPLAFGAWEIALVFSFLNAALLFHRIRQEERALAPRRTVGTGSGRAT